MDCNNVTFVTCFIDIYENNCPTINENNQVNSRNYDWYINSFRYIASSGIKICLYGCDKTKDALIKLSSEYPDNIKFMGYNLFINNPIYESCFNNEYTLPDTRHPIKDTRKYMAIINSKILHVYDTIQKNPWNSNYFSWIDFGIAHILKNKNETLNRLKKITSSNIFKNKLLLIACCHNKIIDKESCYKLLNNVHWRFAGGFFIGDKESISNFYNLYLKYYENFLKENKKVVWEVSFWAWLEVHTDFKFTPYICDHNDSILNNISESIFTD